MTDHIKNDALDVSNEYLLEAAQATGNRDLVRSILRNEYAFDKQSLAVLLHLARYSKGAVWTTLAGEPMILTESMEGWWDGFEYEQEFLVANGSIERETDHYGRIYWRLTKFSWELIGERHPFDLGENLRHERTLALLRTMYLVVKGFPARSVKMYPKLAHSNKEADMEVAPSEDDRARMSMPAGDSRVYVEAVTDHNNSDRVVEKYRAFAQEGAHDSLWLFSSRKVANKWMRAIERADKTDVSTGYAWSATTPIQTLNERVTDPSNGIDGIDGVVTFQQLEDMIEESVYDEMIRETEPVHRQRRTVGEGQARLGGQ